MQMAGMQVFFRVSVLIKRPQFLLSEKAIVCAVDSPINNGVVSFNLATVLVLHLN